MSAQLKILNMSREQIKESLDNIFLVHYDIPYWNIKEESLVKDDLGLDSIDVVELGMMVEDEFKITLKDEYHEHITTVGSLVDFIFEEQ